MAINKDELTLLSSAALISLSISVSQSSSFFLGFNDPSPLTHLPSYIFPYLLALFLPVCPRLKRSCFPSVPFSPLFSPSISLRLTQQSIMCRALDAGLPLTPSFIRTLKSRNHSLLSSAGRCHLLRYPSHLADDQYEPFLSVPPSLLLLLLHCISFTSASLQQRVF